MSDLTQFNQEDGVTGYTTQASLGQSITMYFNQGESMVLRLNISSSAVADQSCGIGKDQIYPFLWNTGKDIIRERTKQDYENIMITSYDVKQGKLITPFQNLRRDTE